MCTRKSNPPKALKSGTVENYKPHLFTLHQQDMA
nr:MAG TPA: hypothetical protein [Caudoviricetes sp.]